MAVMVGFCSPALILAWDLVAPETLSAAFARAPRWVAVGSTAVVCAHLFDLLPEQVDPLHQLGHVRNIRKHR
jgi:hypothetical protein